jgi:hypothetical protein
MPFVNRDIPIVLKARPPENTKSIPFFWNLVISIFITSFKFIGRPVIFKEESLLSQAPAIGHHQHAAFQQVNHFKITKRVDNFS